MKLRPLILTLICILVIFSGCAKDSYFVGYDINVGTVNLDPQFYTDKTAKMVIMNTYEGLVVADSNGDIHPGVAESWNISADGLTYTFKLRKNSLWKKTKYSKERPVKAEDFKFAFVRMFNSNAPSPYADNYLNIAGSQNLLAGKNSAENLGVYADSPYELVIKLESPENNFIDKLANPEASPCNEEFFESTRGRYGLSQDLTLGNGPFVLSRWEETRMSMSKSEAYNGETIVVLDAVDFYIDRDDTMYRFKDERTDILKVTEEQLEVLNSKKYTVKEFNDVTWCLAFNMEAEYWSDIDFRKATTYAIDREKLNISEKSSFSMANSILPHKANEEYSAQPTYNVQKAIDNYNNALTTADIRQVPSANIYIPAGEHKHILEPIQAEWKESLNLFYSFTEVPRNDLEVKLRAGNFDIALLPLTLNSSDPEFILEQFTTDAKQNYMQYDSDAYNLLVKQLQDTGDSDKHLEIAEKAEQQLYKDAVIAPLYTEKGYYILSQSAKDIDIYFNEGTIRFHTAASN